MPKYATERQPLDLVFAALADPTRRAIVERLSVAPASTSQLASDADMALPSFLQHLDVLERAGLVTSHKTGRVRSYQLAIGPIEQADTWLSKQRNHWLGRADRFDRLVTKEHTS